MASIQYGALVTNLVGKVGGQNFQRGKASPILRNIATKRRFWRYKQFVTGYVTPRAALTYVAQSWKGVSSANRAAWLAAAPSFPRLNKFGSVYIPSAFQLFCEMNTLLVLTGASTVETAPTLSTFVAPVWSVAYDSEEGSITFTQGAPFTTSDYPTLIRGSYYQSNGRQVKVALLVVFKHKVFSSGSTTYVATADIIATFGPIVPGTTMWFSLTQYNVATGESTRPVYLSVAF